MAVDLSSVLSAPEGIRTPNLLIRSLGDVVSWRLIQSRSRSGTAIRQLLNLVRSGPVAVCTAADSGLPKQFRCTHICQRRGLSEHRMPDTPLARAPLASLQGVALRRYLQTGPWTSYGGCGRSCEPRRASTRASGIPDCWFARLPEHPAGGHRPRSEPISGTRGARQIQPAALLRVRVQRTPPRSLRPGEGGPPSLAPSQLLPSASSEWCHRLVRIPTHHQATRRRRAPRCRLFHRCSFGAIGAPSVSGRLSEAKVKPTISAPSGEAAVVASPFRGLSREVPAHV